MQVEPDKALFLLNEAAGSCKLVETQCSAQLRRTCIGTLDDAALCLLLTNFCACTNPKPEPALLSAIATAMLAPRISELQNPASRQLFSAISCVVSCQSTIGLPIFQRINLDAMYDVTSCHAGEGPSSCIFAFIVFYDERDHWRPSMRNVDSLYQGIVATSFCSRFFDVRAELFLIHSSI